MRVLFRDTENTLNCVEATHMTYDQTDRTLWLYVDNQIYQAEYNKIYAEARIKEAFTEGKIDLSDDLGVLFEEWTNEEENGL